MISSLALLALAPQAACLDVGDPELVHAYGAFDDPALVHQAVHLANGDVWTFLLDDHAPLGATDLFAIRYAAANGAWQEPVLLATGLEEIDELYQPIRACLAPDGTAWLAAVETGDRNELHMRSLAPGGAWSAPVTLDEYDPGPGAAASSVDVRALASGEVVVAWAVRSASEHSIRTVVRDVSGAWGAPVVATPPAIRPTHPTLAVSRDGASLHLFCDDLVDFAGADGLYHLTYDASAQAFDAPVLLPGSENHAGASKADRHLAVAADDGGGAVAFWWETADGTILHEVHGARFEGGAWLPDETVLGPVLVHHDLTLAERFLDVTASGEYLMLTVVGGPTPGSRLGVPLHWRPGVGFFPGPAVFEMPGGGWDGALHVYDGDRALLMTDVVGEPMAVAYTGAEWSLVPFDLQQPFWVYHASSGPSGVLLLNQWAVFGDEQVRATWITGKTAFAELEGAIPGAAGEPRLTGQCDLAVGEPVSLLLADAAPDAPAILAVGDERLDLPLLGGVLIPAPVVGVPAVTDAGGAIDLTLPWPPGLAPGHTLYHQWWVLDPLAPSGVAASNGLAGTQP